MRISVVINTYNRAESLRKTLESLRHQTCGPFEVVVVNGPSRDATDAVLTEFAGAVRTASCPVVHLSRSRNIGIAESSGDVVAFIDDDAIPEPPWLDDLLAAYEDPQVGGAGGIVFDHSGVRLQYERAVFSRLGMCSTTEVFPPFDRYTQPGADPFFGLLGTNASFRRDCLVRIGGFDEEIEYFLDETEVCMQVIDLGYAIRALPGAAVHHKCLPSNRRNEQRVVLDPFAAVKNQFYYAMQHGRRTRSVGEILDQLIPFVERVTTPADEQVRHGVLTAAQHEFFLHRVRRGVEVGLTRGLLHERQWCEIPPADGAKFLPFPTLSPAGPRRTFCFLAGPCHALAAAVAARGHESHLIIDSADVNRVDFEDGVWVHRLAPTDRTVPGMAASALNETLARAAAFYHEVSRLHRRRPVDLVISPLGDSSGLLCALDEGLPDVVAHPLPANGAAPQPTDPPLALNASRLPAAIESLLQDAHGGRIPEQTLTRVLEGYELNVIRHGGASGRPVDGSQGRLAAAVADLLSGTVRLPADGARRAAEMLLDPACRLIDYPRAVGKLWRFPNEEFVAGLYRLFCDREPTRSEVTGHTTLLERGSARRDDTVRWIVELEEAQRQNHPTDWLAELPSLARRWRGEPSPGRVPVQRVRAAVLLPLRGLARVCRWSVRRLGGLALRCCGTMPPLRRCIDVAGRFARLPGAVSKMQGDLQQELHKALRSQEWIFWHTFAATLEVQGMLRGREGAQEASRRKLAG